MCNGEKNPFIVTTMVTNPDDIPISERCPFCHETRLLYDGTCFECDHGTPVQIKLNFNRRRRRKCLRCDHFFMTMKNAYLCDNCRYYINYGPVGLDEYGISVLGETKIKCI